jgi:hypothetical protein
MLSGFNKLELQTVEIAPQPERIYRSDQRTNWMQVHYGAPKAILLAGVWNLNNEFYIQTADFYFVRVGGGNLTPI